MLTATISGKFLSPDLTSGNGITAYIRAVTDGSRLAYAGNVIAGRIPVKINSNGYARVNLPVLPQSGLTPTGARWRLHFKVLGFEDYWDFTLAADMLWTDIVDVSNVPLTSSIQTAAEAARDAALAAVASVAYSTWQPTTSYVTNQTVQAPDGSLIKRKTGGTSRASFDATEQALWTVVAAALGTLDNTAALAAAWARAPRVADLTYPVAIAHRGSADISPEDTVDAMKSAVTRDGFTLVEAGDVQALSDGTLVMMHDSTVDRTTNGTGNVNTFTKATWAALQVDILSQSGGTYTTQPAPLWDDALTALAGRCIVVPECKDTLTATLTAMLDRLDALGAKDSIIMQSFNTGNLITAASRGYYTMQLSGTFSGISTIDYMKTNGIWSVCVDGTSADFTAANVALWQGSGFRVFAYNVDRQASAATILATGCDGYFTNQSKDYALLNPTGYRKTATTWHRTGRWETGMFGQSSQSPMDTGTRGTLVGAPGAWRVKIAGARNVSVGSVSPVANAAGTYTVTVTAAVDTIPTTTTQGPSIYVAAPDDSGTLNAADIANSYLLKVRASGGVQLWEIPGSGGVTSLGTLTTAAMQNLTTTASLTGGTSYTSISVSALTVALKVGHQFMLSTGQIATVNAAAIVGATSVTIQAIVPNATVASGSSLIPYVTLVITVSPTTVTAQRGDETTAGTISAANTAHRGGYVYISAAGYASPGVCSYHTVKIA